MINQLKYFLICSILITSCSSGPVDLTPPDWAKNISIYEVMTKQYSDKKNFKGIQEDLQRIREMHFKTICLLPIFERDESNNPFNPNSPYAVKSFETIDPLFGTSDDLNELIDSAHKYNIRVLVQWNFTGTGPHHPWRTRKKEYYLSDQMKIENRYNKDYVKFDHTNKSLQRELLNYLKRFLKVNKFDGIVLYNLDLFPEVYIEEIVKTILQIRPMLIINNSNTFITQCHFNVNNNLFNYFQSAYEGQLTVSGFQSMLDTINKFPCVNYLQDYLKTDKYGPDANVFYNAYKYYHTLTYFLPGIPWVLNGQEDPQFESLTLFSSRPFSRKYKYNNDFYRSLNLLKLQHPAVWNFQVGNLPIKVSDSNLALAMERTQDSLTCVGIFNLTDTIINYTLNKEYIGYYDLFNKFQVSLPKNTNLSLGPYQSIILTNRP
jgi:cyclomaltodextrinase / maltogenic alpha-amylase / neopullulanase